MFSSFQLLSHVWLFATPWTAAHQASLAITNYQSLLKLMSIESVMPSNHLIHCHPLLLPSIFPSIRVFSNESVIFFLIYIFLCRPFLKSLLNLLQYCFCFMICFFGHEACGILVPQPGIKPTPLGLESKVLTTVPPRESPNESVLCIRWPKYWSFSFIISPSNEYSGLILLGWTGWIALLSKGHSRVFSNITVQNHQFFGFFNMLSWLVMVNVINIDILESVWSSYIWYVWVKCY